MDVTIIITSGILSWYCHINLCQFVIKLSYCSYAITIIYTTKFISPSGSFTHRGTPHSTINFVVCVVLVFSRGIVESSATDRNSYHNSATDRHYTSIPWGLMQRSRLLNFRAQLLKGQKKYLNNRCTPANRTNKRLPVYWLLQGLYASCRYFLLASGPVASNLQRLSD